MWHGLQLVTDPDLGDVPIACIFKPVDITYFSRHNGHSKGSHQIRWSNSELTETGQRLSRYRNEIPSAIASHTISSQSHEAVSNIRPHGF